VLQETLCWWEPLVHVGETFCICQVTVNGISIVFLIPLTGSKGMLLSYQVHRWTTYKTSTTLTQKAYLNHSFILWFLFFSPRLVRWDDWKFSCERGSNIWWNENKFPKVWHAWVTNFREDDTRGTWMNVILYHSTWKRTMMQWTHPHD